MLRRKFLSAAVLAVAAMVALPPPSQAAFNTFRLKLESGSSTLIVDLKTIGANASSEDAPVVLAGSSAGFADGTGRLDSAFFVDYSKFTAAGLNNAGFDVLKFAGYEITFESEANNLPGTSTRGVLNLRNGTVFNDTATADLKISLTALEYEKPTLAQGRNFEANFTGILSTQIGTNLGASVESHAYFDQHSENSGTEFSTGTIDLTETFVTTGGDFGNGNAPVPGGNAPPPTHYTLTNTILIKNLAQQSVTGTLAVEAVVTPVPAPAGLILVATVVPFFGLLRRRMKTVPTT